MRTLLSSSSVVGGVSYFAYQVAGRHTLRSGREQLGTSQVDYGDPQRGRRHLNRSGRFASASRVALACLPALMALSVWRWSLRDVSLDHLTDYGLPPALPLSWYAALAVCVIGAVMALSVRKPRGWLVALYIGAIILILFATVPVLSSTPHYSWVYKHFGVTQFIELHGHTSPEVDIYNRWPGFFAFGAVFSQLAGQSDPAAYAAWAEPMFVLLDVLVLTVLVRGLSRDVRVAGATALFFVLGNWVGQSYYSPQAFAFLLSLGLFAILMRQLRPEILSTSGERLVTLLTKFSRHTAPPPPSVPSDKWINGFAIAAVIALDAVVIASHQLTPYVALVQVGVLTLLGIVRPRWLILIMAGMTIFYLVLNFNYVTSHYGLFTSIDPFNNAKHVTLGGAEPRAGKNFSGLAGQALAFLVWILSGAGAFALIRKGYARRLLPVLALGAAPFSVLFGQNYGGEAILRIILFTLPWCSIMAAWAWSTIRSGLVRLSVACVAAGAMTALFVPAFLGQEELNTIPPAEVTASRHFYTHAKSYTVMMLSGPDFPGRYGARYNQFVGPKGDDDPNLLKSATFRHRPLGSKDIGKVIDVMHQYAPHGYLVFSTSQNEYARIFRLTPPDALKHLERAVARSSKFHLWYVNSDTRIYELNERP